jgi:hypothetical protein
MGVQNVLDAGDGSGDHHEFVFLNCTANKALVGKDQDGIGAPYNTGCLSSASDKTNFAVIKSDDHPNILDFIRVVSCNTK